MEPSILPGEIILVCKMSYGPRLLRVHKYFSYNKVEFHRIKGWNKPKKGDIVFFNWPQYNSLSDSSLTIWGDYTVKRCFGLPGDSVVIKKLNNSKKLNGNSIDLIEEIPESNLVQFPHDSTLAWTVNNYGPLYVPSKGQTMQLTPKNVLWYREILLYENPMASINEGNFFINDEAQSLYTFRHNYYFMLGDNSDYSQDSRSWGFVPDENIIGRGTLIIISLDPKGRGLKKVRCNRFLKFL